MANNKRKYTPKIHLDPVNHPGQFGIKMNKNGHWNNYWFPTEMFDPASKNYDPQTSIAMLKDPHDLQKWIAKIRFPRVRVDLTQWRESILQAEDPIFPFRWSVQQIYQDLILDAHLTACMDKCKRLTTQKKAWFFDKNKKAIDDLPDNLKFIESEWWMNLIDYILDAKFFGYQLIALGDMVDYSFPKIHTVDRQNISPDRDNVTPVIAMIEGIRFNDPQQKVKVVKNLMKRAKDNQITYFNNPNEKDENGEAFYDWHIWVTTKKDINRSKCGIGLLYKTAPHVLFIRNAYNDFADFCEKFAQPILHLKTRKTGDQLNQAEENLQATASSMYFISGQDDVLELLKSAGVGESYQAYEKNVELNKKAVTAIVFGHEDAMSLTPGKLGTGGQKGQEGQENSPVAKSIREVQSEQTFWVSNIVNDNVFPKLRNLGFDIPLDFKYGYMNNEEESENQAMEDKHNGDYIENVVALAEIGLDVSPEEVSERTGYTVTKRPPIEVNTSIPKSAEMKLKKIYR